MLSFQDQYQLAQSLTQDFTAGSQTLFQQLINNFQREIETELGTFVTEQQTTFDSINNQLPAGSNPNGNIFPLPPNCIRVKLLWCPVGNTRYIGTPVYNENEWQQYFFSNASIKSNFLSRMIERSDTLEVFPIPASSNTMYMVFEARSPDLSLLDYNTGTVASLSTTNGVTTVTLQGGASLTSQYVGCYLQLVGDTQWYKIFTVPTTTTFTLKTPYVGPLTTFSGINYKIGQLPATPGDTHVLPVYGALSLYFAGPKKDQQFQTLYQGLYQSGLTRAKATYGNRYSLQVVTPSLRQQRAGLSRNPNYYPSNIGP